MIEFKSLFIMSEKICVCIQARLSSKRLPEKVLRKVNEFNLLELLRKRLLKAKKPSQIYILTSNDPSDNKLVKFCEKKGFKFFRGELNNVYKRFRDFLKVHNYQAIARISGDSPLLDHKILVNMTKLFLKNNFDIVTNVFPKTFPSGQSVEIIHRKCFISLSPNRLNKSQKEHVTQYFYENHKSYKILNETCDYDHLNMKLSIDSREDFNKLKKNFLYNKIDADSSIEEILRKWNKIK